MEKGESTKDKMFEGKYKLTKSGISKGLGGGFKVIKKPQWRGMNIKFLKQHIILCMKVLLLFLSRA